MPPWQVIIQGCGISISQGGMNQILLGRPQDFDLYDYDLVVYRCCIKKKMDAYKSLPLGKKKKNSDVFRGIYIYLKKNFNNYIFPKCIL